MSFSFDKVTTGTYISTVNVTGATVAGLAAASTVLSAKTQFFDQVQINSTSKLISGIIKLLQKLLKCFSGTTTSVAFFPTLFALYWGLSTSLPSLSVIFSSTL